MAIISERRSVASTPVAVGEPQDRCRFGPSFDRSRVECPAFQRGQFIAATSYGKPLGTHVACTHLMVGELGTNQFYPRCTLGDQHARMRWLANMGPGRIEVLKALNAEFERLYPDSLRQLIIAKAAVLAAPPDDRTARLTLATVVRDFVSQFTTFITTHADRIAEIGYAPIDLTARAAHVLAEWQHSARLDLPGVDEQSILRPAGADAATGDDVVATSGLMISRTSLPTTVTLVGSIDESNLEALSDALERATVSGDVVIVDLSAVTFCSVAGLRMLTATADAGKLTLHGMQPRLRRAMIAAGLSGTTPPSRRARETSDG
jgi:anti-anti-sigma regulatory factor